MDELDSQADKAGESGATAFQPETVPLSEVDPRARRSPYLMVGLAVLLASAAVVLAVGLNGTPNAAAEVSAAASSTVGIKTATFTIDGSVAAAGQTVQMSGTGAIDTAVPAEQLNMTMTIPGSPQLPMSMIIADGSVFMSSPALSAHLPVGKTWIGIPLPQSGVGSGLGSSFSGPSGPLEDIAHGGGSVTDLGPGTVDGVSVERYGVTIDPATLAQRLDQAHVPANLKASALKAATTLLAGTVVSIDGDKHVRQIAMGGSLDSGGQSINIHMTMDLKNFGAPVTITVPDPTTVDSQTALSGASTSTTGV